MQKTRDLDLSGDAGALVLLVFTGDSTMLLPLPPAGEVVVGRSGDADLRIDADSLSRRHAAISLGGTPKLKDLGSSNGTRLNNRAVGSEWVELQPGDAIQLGAVTAVLRRADGARRPQRRLLSHDYLEARLHEACLRGRPFALLRVSLDPRRAEVDALLAAALAPSDCLASYALGEYEVLLPEASAQKAAAVGEKLEAEPLAAQVGIACFGRDGRDPEALIARANAALGDPRGGASKPIVRSPALAQLFDVVSRVASGDISVLITGETGAGKEMIAAAIHQRSRRAKRPWLTLNCAALSDTLLESELFGHERGAFTGAQQAKPGLLESAQGGTVFLDEVGEMPMATQAKLLRVLEERTTRRVGGLKLRPLDVRFVAATNRDLEADANAGRFRSDLYFRLGGVTLRVPPLRERKEEIEALAVSFAERSAKELGRRPVTLGRAALTLLLGYRWPGNIRELRNVMERAVLLCGGDTIEPEHLPREKLGAVWMSTPDAPLARAGEEPDERARVVAALARCGGNQTRAAKLLGISRRTLLYRLDALAIPRPQKSGAPR